MIAYHRDTWVTQRDSIWDYWDPFLAPLIRVIMYNLDKILGVANIYVCTEGSWLVPGLSITMGLFLRHSCHNIVHEMGKFRILHGPGMSHVYICTAY